jgi:hypothetical protein
LGIKENKIYMHLWHRNLLNKEIQQQKQLINGTKVVKELESKITPIPTTEKPQKDVARLRKRMAKIAAKHKAMPPIHHDADCPACNPHSTTTWDTYVKRQRTRAMNAMKIRFTKDILDKLKARNIIDKDVSLDDLQKLNITGVFSKIIPDTTKPSTVESVGSFQQHVPVPSMVTVEVEEPRPVQQSAVFVDSRCECGHSSSKHNGLGECNAELAPHIACHCTIFRSR